MEHTLSPAYGRDKKSSGEIVRDFAEGKDFTHECGPFCPSRGRYISIRDFNPGDIATLRYNNLRDSIIVIKSAQGTAGFDNIEVIR